MASVQQRADLLAVLSRFRAAEALQTLTFFVPDKLVESLVMFIFVDVVCTIVGQ